MRVPAMSAVAPVHEHMHQRACENQKEGQVTKSVREMLGPEQEPNDNQEGRAHEKRSRRPEAPHRLGVVMMLRAIVH
jgi:hypothetical protein